MSEGGAKYAYIENDFIAERLKNGRNTDTFREAEKVVKAMNDSCI